MTNLSKKKKIALLKEYQRQVESGELVQLTPKNSREYRRKFFDEQDGVCPILRKEIPFEDSTLDHRHRAKSDPFGGPESLGLIRGVLHKFSNSWDGKCYNSYKRSGLKKYITFVDALRNLADYIERPPLEPMYIYASEKPRKAKKLLGKRNYSKVIKHYFNVYPRARKLPRKTKCLTQSWKKYINDTDVYLRKSQNKSKKRKRKQ